MFGHDGARADAAKRGSPFLNTEQAAAWLRVSAKLLKRMRRRSEGPLFRRHGRVVRYHIDDLSAWSEASDGRSRT